MHSICSVTLVESEKRGEEHEIVKLFNFDKTENNKNLTLSIHVDEVLKVSTKFRSIWRIAFGEVLCKYLHSTALEQSK